MELPAVLSFPELDPRRLWGGLLAGGAGQRLGGRDKGWLMLGGHPLVQHVLGSMQAHCSQVVISASRNRAAYAALGYPVVADIVPCAGPLGGMVSLFAAFPQQLWLMAPCDTLGWPDDLVQRLWARYQEGRYDVVIVGCENRLMPVLGLYGPGCQPQLIRAFQEGERAPCRALDGLSWDVLWLAPGALININTPKALQAAAAAGGFTPP